jgi:asparagine synthase (glutamine-hydrolysing)
VPGLTIVAGKDLDAKNVVAGVRSMASDDAVTELLSEVPGHLAIVWSAYASYPRHISQTERGLAILEGTHLGRSKMETDAQLRELILAFEESREGGVAEIERWASEADGDFVLAVVSLRASRMAVCNDALSRLPLYVRQSDERLTLSREIKMLVALSGPGNPDRHALAQALTHGFPFGGRTFIEEVRYVDPASILSVAFEKFDVRRQQYRVWNFESMLTCRRADERVVNDLVDSFVATCREQAQTAPAGAIVALSGGNDSRCVAAGLVRAGCRARAMTFASPVVSALDVQLAERVANSLAMEWELVPVVGSDWAQLVEASLLRDGLNYAGIAHVVQFLKLMRRDFGSGVLHFSGDGGDRVLPDLRPPWWVNSTRHHAAYRLERGMWAIEDVAAMLGLSKKQVFDTVAEHLAAYPERNATYRDVHYHILDRGFRWMAEGEERNRAFFLHQSPFYGRRFFEAAMGIHPNEKRGYKLYARFLQALAPNVARLPTAKWDTPLYSGRDRCLNLIESLPFQLPAPLGSRLYRWLRPLRARWHEEGSASRYRLQIEKLLQDPAVAATFAPRTVEEKLSSCSEVQFNVLVTELIYTAKTWS